MIDPLLVGRCCLLMHSFHEYGISCEYEITTKNTEKIILPKQGYLSESINNFKIIREFRNNTKIEKLPFYLLQYFNEINIIGGENIYSFLANPECIVHGPFENKEDAEDFKKKILYQIEIISLIDSRFT